MPKLNLVSALVLSAVALVSCGGKFKSNDAEATLRKNGFSVTVTAGHEYGSLPVGKEYPIREGLVNYLVGINEPKNQELHAWFFASDDKAKAWFDEYLTEIFVFEFVLSVELSSLGMGRQDNVVWTGCYSLATELGWAGEIR